MGKVKEIPQQVGEFIDLAREYVKQRTVEPARALGRAAGFGFGAAVAFTLAAIFLAVAGMRAIVDALPGTLIWGGFGYILAALGLLVAAGIIGWRALK